MNRFNQTITGLITKCLLFAILSATVIITLSALPVDAISDISYKYYNSGTEIGAVGGKFGDNAVVKLSKNSTGAYVGTAQVTYTYNDNWAIISWTGIGNKTATCIAGVQINVKPISYLPNSNNKNTGSISTPSSLNQPKDSISAVGSTNTNINSCSAEVAANISDFNQENISISGNITDTTQITNQAENENSKRIFVIVYSNKSAQQLPDVKVTLAPTMPDFLTIPSGPTITSESLVFDNEYAVDKQVLFKDTSPGTYLVCVTPPSIGFDFDQCQTVTKVLGSPLTVNFGSINTVYNVNGKSVNVTVDITMSGSGLKGKYGPMNIILSDASGKVITSTNTNNYDIKTYDSPSDPITLSAKFDPIEPGTYKVCVADSNLCSDNFVKAVNQKSDVKIIIGASESDKYFTSPGSSKTSCAIDGGLGWIICPVMNFMAKIVDGAQVSVDYLLTTPSINTSSINPDGSSNGTYAAWQMMRTIANVAFVIAFLVIIFSQLTSIGITNYGIKKMLPRLVIAAILVNLSYFICVIAVDISNILGSSMKHIFDDILNHLTIPGSNNVGKTGTTWDDILVKVWAISGALIFVSMGVLCPALVAALFAIVTVFLVLTLRQALIILLIVISPLAFVAFLLPNTENLFKKWRELFTTLLLMFPIISIIFGASELASKVIMASSPDTTVQIMGALMAIIPLAITPVIMKTAGGILNRFGGIVNNPNKGPFDRLKKGAASFGEDIDRARATKALNKQDFGRFGKHYLPGRGSFTRWGARRKKIKAGREAVLNEATTGYVARIATGEGIDPGKKGIGDRFISSRFRTNAAGGVFMINEASPEAMKTAMARAVSELEKLDQEKVVVEISRITQASDPIKLLADAKAEFIDAITKGDTVRARAAQNILSATSPGRDMLRDVYRDSLIPDPDNPNGPSIHAYDTVKAFNDNKDLSNKLRSDIIKLIPKEKDAALARLGYTGEDLSVIETDDRTYKQLAGAALAGQSAASLKIIRQTGAISGASALEVLTSDKLKTDLSEEQKTELRIMAAVPVDQDYNI